MADTIVPVPMAPYLSDYATGLAKCASANCNNVIVKGTLRLGVRKPNTTSDHVIPRWYHEDCFFKTYRPTNVTDISDFIKLNETDRAKIKRKLDQFIIMPDEDEENQETGTKRPVDKGSTVSNEALKDYRVEKSKSNLVPCHECSVTIVKGDIYVSKMGFNADFVRKKLRYCVKCFNDKRDDFKFYAGGKILPGFETLSEDYQAIVLSEIKPRDFSGIPMKRLKVEKDETDLGVTVDNEMEAQTVQFDQLRDELKKLQMADLKALLEHNSQKAPRNNYNECLFRLADMMAYGSLDPCPMCEGRLEYDTFYYKCTGEISDNRKCQYVTNNPERQPMDVPKEYTDMDLFREFQASVGVRLFPVGPIVLKEAKTEFRFSNHPLKCLEFFLYGVEDKNKIVARILKLGGKCVTKLAGGIAAVVSTKRDLDRMPKRMKEIKDLQIEVVEASFLDKIDVQSGSVFDIYQLIRDNNIAEWGSDPEARLAQNEQIGKSTMKPGRSKKSIIPALTMKIIEGTAVHPACRLGDSVRVAADCEGNTYSVVLNKTDVGANKNSFYYLQLLEHDNMYKLFCFWGKTGTPRNKTDLKEFASAEKAKQMFENKFLEKTGISWDWYLEDSFDKMPGKYYPLSIDYAPKLEVDASCDLPVALGKLIELIFNKDILKNTLIEIELDTELSPLGKLSKKQIYEGFEVLRELLKRIEDGSACDATIKDATSKFYTLIPHTNTQTELNNKRIIEKKADMLEYLRGVEVSYRLMQTGIDVSSNTIKSLYGRLNANIVPLDKASDEFRLVEEYARNSHIKRGSEYTLEIEQVFAVSRQGEAERFQQFRDLHNKRLLWHGSRLAHQAGILTEGLCINQTGVVSTGDMFGKGLYFTDMLYKAAFYCYTSRANTTGLVMLCEVVLGDMYECTGLNDVQLVSFPVPGKHSVWGVGQWQPDPAGDRALECGTLVPLGEPREQLSFVLQHNEFVVYDAAQVKLKYLVQLNFNYMNKPE